ncbi:hypothetical protein N9N67_05650 [Bacteriovoracaceae bacterium]|nr:hypothetical protein [Bacteriovoracaceae bacterium]
MKRIIYLVLIILCFNLSAQIATLGPSLTGPMAAIISEYLYMEINGDGGCNCRLGETIENLSSEEFVALLKYYEAKFLKEIENSETPLSFLDLVNRKKLNSNYPDYASTVQEDKKSGKDDNNGDGGCNCRTVVEEVLAAAKTNGDGGGNCRNGDLKGLIDLQRDSGGAGNCREGDQEDVAKTAVKGDGGGNCDAFSIDDNPYKNLALDGKLSTDELDELKKDHISISRHGGGLIVSYNINVVKIFMSKYFIEHSLVKYEQYDMMRFKNFGFDWLKGINNQVITRDELREIVLAPIEAISPTMARGLIEKFKILDEAMIHIEENYKRTGKSEFIPTIHDLGEQAVQTYREDSPNYIDPIWLHLYRNVFDWQNRYDTKTNELLPTNWIDEDGNFQTSIKMDYELRESLSDQYLGIGMLDYHEVIAQLLREVFDPLDTVAAQNLNMISFSNHSNLLKAKMMKVVIDSVYPDVRFENGKMIRNNSTKEIKKNQPLRQLSTAGVIMGRDIANEIFNFIDSHSGELTQNEEMVLDNWKRWIERENKLEKEFFEMEKLGFSPTRLNTPKIR